MIKRLPPIKLLSVDDTVLVNKKSGTPEHHPWRLCPLGEHFVSEHSRKTHSGTTTIHAHCAKNPTKRDILYPDEMREMAALHFNTEIQMPCPNQLDFGEIGHAYDSIIAGWTTYWNDVLKPEISLAPNQVKALIASESSFKITAKNRVLSVGGAHGLMQVTGQTTALLGGSQGGLNEHFIGVSKKDLYDPILNVACGVRWLFEKKKLAEANLKRKTSWEEAVAAYKSELKKLPENRVDTNKYLGYLFIYEKCFPEENITK